VSDVLNMFFTHRNAGTFSITGATTVHKTFVPPRIYGLLVTSILYLCV